MALRRLSSILNSNLIPIYLLEALMKTSKRPFNQALNCFCLFVLTLSKTSANSQLSLPDTILPKPSHQRVRVARSHCSMCILKSVVLPESYQLHSKYHSCVLFSCKPTSWYFVCCLYASCSALSLSLTVR